MLNLPQIHLPAVDKDNFDRWRSDPVTEHFLRDIEHTYIDCMLDPLPTQSMDKLTLAAIRRDAYRELIDKILDWTPKGIDREEGE